MANIVIVGANQGIDEAGDRFEKLGDVYSEELTVMDGGEHWFHTKEQMEFLGEWMKKAICVV